MCVYGVVGSLVTLQQHVFYLDVFLSPLSHCSSMLLLNDVTAGCSFFFVVARKFVVCMSFV